MTGYSAVDQATHDARNLPVILKAMHAEWAIPLQPNPYAVKVQPDECLPPMTLWAPPGEEEQKFHGISAKNAGKSMRRRLYSLLCPNLSFLKSTRNISVRCTIYERAFVALLFRFVRERSVGVLKFDHVSLQY